MEQSSQVGTEVAAALAGPAAAEPAGDDVLREELAKWRERVPKLAAALRQRAEEAEALKQEVERLRRTPDPGQDLPAGIRARDELIDELESKLADLSERHRAAQAELHGQRLEAGELKHELGSWKEKWQSVTRSLDAQAAQAGQRDQQTRELTQANESLRQRLAEQTAAQGTGQRALEEALEERDSLRRRNEQLFETTELANRQIGSLTDSLSELRASLKQHREREPGIVAERDAMREERDALHQELAALRARHAELEAELTGELHLAAAAASAAMRAGAETDRRVADAHRRREQAEARLAEVVHARDQLQAQLHEQVQEVARLTGVVEVAQRTTAERDNERRELSERMQALEARNEHLEQQLGERSALVVTMEQDQADASRRREALEQERNELEEALIRAQRNVKESVEHITALDDKLERQKELMERLEEELAEARQEHSLLAKARTEMAGSESEVARLNEQVRKLEGLVRERTEALNRLEWQRHIADDAPSGTEAPQPLPDEGADGKLLLVLNQQLSDARARNDELLARIRRLEADAPAHAGENAVSGDDLTRIHGVGQKLAEQLNDLGIHRYQQIAELDADDLADERHVLHGHRGRILRDGWIDQAVALIRH